MKTRIVAAAALVALTGCDPDDPKLEATSTAIHESAEDCLKTVRDQHAKYAETSSCNALGSLSMRYLEAGGDKPGKTPAKYDLRYVGAQRMAWTALAMSESCSNKPPRIW